MAKVIRRSSLNTPPHKSQGAAILILKGTIASIIISFLFTLFLSLISLLTESIYIDSYMQYIIVAVTMTSIFIGSVYATQQAESLGLIIGIIIGVIYVLFTLAIGMKLSSESVPLLILVNKLAAGIAAGALGGLVGVNLS